MSCRRTCYSIHFVRGDLFDAGDFSVRRARRRGEAKGTMVNSGGGVAGGRDGQAFGRLGSSSVWAIGELQQRVTSAMSGRSVLRRSVLRGPLLRRPVLRGPLLRGPLLRRPVLRGPVLRGPQLRAAAERHFFILGRRKGLATRGRSGRGGPPREGWWRRGYGPELHHEQQPRLRRLALTYLAGRACLGRAPAGRGPRRARAQRKDLTRSFGPSVQTAA